MTAQMETALAALLTNPDRKSAAKAAGITDRTLRKYFQNDEFRQAYRDAYNEILVDAVAQGKQMLQEALHTFKDVMNNTNESGATRVAAGRAACEYTARLSEQVDIIADIAELKKAVFSDESNH